METVEKDQKNGGDLKAFGDQRKRRVQAEVSFGLTNTSVRKIPYALPTIQYNITWEKPSSGKQKIRYLGSR